MTVSLSIWLVSIVLAFLVGSFGIWRSLKSDYENENIINTLILLTAVTIVVSLGWKWWTVGGMMALPLLALISWNKLHHRDVWEWLDAMAAPVALASAILVFGREWKNWPQAVVLVGVCLLLVTVKKNYRRLAWYKSGRPGFVGITGLLLASVVWLLIAKWHTSNLYWGGLAIEQWVAVWAIIACTVSLYLRGGRRVTQDWKGLVNTWQLKTKKT